MKGSAFIVSHFFDFYYGYPVRRFLQPANVFLVCHGIHHLAPRGLTDVVTNVQHEYFVGHIDFTQV